MKLRFEPLAPKHDRASFTSGSAAIDRWFRTQAGQDERRAVTRVFVALDEDGIAGFYTLSMISIALDAVPADVARRLPKYPDVPAALIGRLARATRLRGQQVGEILAFDAVRRILDASRSIAAAAIIVDAKDEKASAFYLALGFRPFPTRPGRLFMLAETAAAAVAKVDRQA